MTTYVSKDASRQASRTIVGDLTCCSQVTGSYFKDGPQWPDLVNGKYSNTEWRDVNNWQDQRDTMRQATPAELFHTAKIVC